LRGPFQANWNLLVGFSLTAALGGRLLREVVDSLIVKVV
jgi:hypothetical protein